MTDKVEEAAAGGDPPAKRVREGGIVDVLRFAEESSLTTIPEYAKAFERIAEFLLDRCTLFIAGIPHRLTEIEAYYRGGSHQDVYPHCDELQKTHAHWYFHRSGDSYRSGTYKGLDITFGGDDSFGGFLIRGMVSLAPPTDFLDGPCLCVDRILKLNHCASIAEFVEREGTTEATTAAAAAATTTRGLYIALAEKPHGVRLYKSARVGLTLKGYTEEKEKFIMRNYRYLTNPRDTKKGKQLLVAALRQDGFQIADIVHISGSTRTSVEHCTAAYDAGTKTKDSSKFRNTALGSEESCILYGFAAAHDLI